MNRHNLLTNYQQIRALQHGISAQKSALKSQKLDMKQAPQRM